jgi:hypothetical protein
MSNKFLIGKIADLFFEKGIERDLPGVLKEVYYLGPDRYVAPDKSSNYVTYNLKAISSRIARAIPKDLVEADERQQWFRDALYRIETEHAIDCAGMTAGYCVGRHVLHPSGTRLLVTRTNRPIKPKPGQCDLILSLLSQLFGPLDPSSPKYSSDGSRSSTRTC